MIIFDKVSQWSDEWLNLRWWVLTWTKLKWALWWKQAQLTQIYELKNHLKIPVVCNWDIKNYDDWISKLKNLDGFMIWRWSFWNPWAFLPGNYKPSLWEILDIMEFHASKLIETTWEKKWSLEVRKHLVLYLRDFPWVKNYRKSMVGRIWCP